MQLSWQYRHSLLINSHKQTTISQLLFVLSKYKLESVGADLLEFISPDRLPYLGSDRRRTALSSQFLKMLTGGLLFAVIQLDLSLRK